MIVRNSENCPYHYSQSDDSFKPIVWPADPSLSQDNNPTTLEYLFFQIVHPYPPHTNKTNRNLKNDQPQLSKNNANECSNKCQVRFPMILNIPWWIKGNQNNICVFMRQIIWKILATLQQIIWEIREHLAVSSQEGPLRTIGKKLLKECWAGLTSLRDRPPKLRVL